MILYDSVGTEFYKSHNQVESCQNIVELNWKTCQIFWRFYRLVFFTIRRTHFRYGNILWKKKVISTTDKDIMLKIIKPWMGNSM